MVRALVVSEAGLRFAFSSEMSSDADAIGSSTIAPSGFLAPLFPAAAPLAPPPVPGILETMRHSAPRVLTT